MENENLSFLWQQTYATLFATTSKLQTKGDMALQHLTSRQLMLLIAILHLEEDATLSNVAKMIGSSKQSTKQIVEILKKKEFLEARQNSEDKRAITLSMTEQGKIILKEEYDRGMEIFKIFFGNFNEEELKTFWGFLKRLYSFDGEEQLGYEKKMVKESESV